MLLREISCAVNIAGKQALQGKIVETGYESFADYLQAKYYRILFKAVEKRLEEEGAIYGYGYSGIAEKKLRSIEVKFVSFQEVSGKHVGFKAKVQATIVKVCVGIGSDIEVGTYLKNFAAACSADLYDGELHEFHLYELAGYQKEDFSDGQYDPYLVPYLSREKLDSAAEAILEKYYPEALEKPEVVVPEKLVEAMGVSMHYARLPYRIFGRSYFTSGMINACLEDGSGRYPKKVEAGSIVVDPKKKFLRGAAARSNTIVHECVHQELHRMFFEMKRLLEGTVDPISCNAQGKYDEKAAGAKKALQWIEWQANALTPHIQVPTKTARLYVARELGKLYYDFPDARPAEIMEEVVARVADAYGVSKTAAKIRVIEMGFEQAAGTWLYAGEDKYFPPISFDGGIYQKGKTYTIPERTAFQLVYKEPSLRQLFLSKKIVYANQMFCLNDAKYVVAGRDGHYWMTSYGLEHVGECCLVFDRDITRTEYDDSYYRMCFLCREIIAKDFEEATYDPDYEDNQNVTERAREMELILQETDHLSEIMLELPGGFAGTLDYHIKRRKLTNEKMEERSGISERWIRELRKKEGTSKELATVLALCIGLNLHPFLAEDLITKSGYRLGYTKEHMIYRWLISQHMDENLDAWNRHLQEAGIHQKIPPSHNEKSRCAG